MKLKKIVPIYFLIFFAIILILKNYFWSMSQNTIIVGNFWFALFGNNLIVLYVFIALSATCSWISMFIKKHKVIVFTIFCYITLFLILPIIINILKNAQDLIKLLEYAPLSILGIFIVAFYFVALLYLIICDIYILVNRRLQEKRKMQERLTYLESQIDKKIDK